MSMREEDEADAENTDAVDSDSWANKSIVENGPRAGG